KENLPVCSEKTKVTYEPMQHKLPSNLEAIRVLVESPRASCEGQWLAVTSTGGDFFMGIPWFLDDVKEERTLEDKLKKFAWTALKQNVDATVDRSARAA